MRGFHPWGLLLQISTVVSLALADQSGDPFVIRISCGSRVDVYTPPGNTLWFRDFGYTGGNYANATRPSFVTPALSTLRYFSLTDGPENCYYINNMPGGRYQVRIFFGLINDPSLDTEPLFDIAIEGTLVTSLTSGWSRIDEQSFTESMIFVRDSNISVCFFSTGHGQPSVLSLEVFQIDDSAYAFGQSWGRGTMLKTIKRLTCGTGKTAFDASLNGTEWGGDRLWFGVTTLSNSSEDQAISTNHTIMNALVSPNYYPQEIYQTAIVGTNRSPDLSIQLDVEPKYYSIWLHFAEIEVGVYAVGQRVFDVIINGNTAFQGVDIIKLAAANFTALVLKTTISVTGISLTINFNAVSGSRAIVSAIEVFEVIRAENKTSLQEVSALQSLKHSLGLPIRFGWNGDPCVPQQHPWSGVDCLLNVDKGEWVIEGIDLDSQGLKGYIDTVISNLENLISLNLSSNSIVGSIPSSLGGITGLQILDLSYNQLSGLIPQSLGQLQELQILNLNDNDLSGQVPANLGGRPLHRASFNFSGNPGLCGIPGLQPCGLQLSTGAKIGIAFAALVTFLVLVVAAACWYKRRQNIIRIQQIQAAREAPYAKARTHFNRDIQLGKFHRPRDSSPNRHENIPRPPRDSSPNRQENIPRLPRDSSPNRNETASRPRDASPNSRESVPRPREISPNRPENAPPRPQDSSLRRPETTPNLL